MERISIQKTPIETKSDGDQDTLWLVEPSEQAIVAFERREAEIIMAETPDPVFDADHCIGSLVLMPT